jgi:hypothetical protein
MIDAVAATADARISWRNALLRFLLSRKIRIRKSP